MIMIIGMANDLYPRSTMARRTCIGQNSGDARHPTLDISIIFRTGSLQSAKYHRVSTGNNSWKGDRCWQTSRREGTVAIDGSKKFNRDLEKDAGQTHCSQKHIQNLENIVVILPQRNVCCSLGQYVHPQTLATPDGIWTRCLRRDV